MSLDVRRDGAATWITLDRPDALNALDGPVRRRWSTPYARPPATRACGRWP